MPPKTKKKSGRGRSRKGDTSDIEDELPPPAPPRPFNNVEGLPLSVEEPEYNLLNSPLSLKDSAVLYSSLMKSRRAYVNGNIFDLYWAKGKTKFDNDSNARDRMNKLCDCGMQIGPHSFDVRFFILKDDEIERKRTEEKDKKKEKRLANKKLREEKKQQKLLAKTDSSNNIATGESNVQTDPSKSEVDGVQKDDVTSKDDDDSSSDDNDENDDNEDNDDKDRDESTEQREQTEQEEEPTQRDQSEPAESEKEFQSRSVSEQPESDKPKESSTISSDVQASQSPAPTQTQTQTPISASTPTPAPAPASVPAVTEKATKPLPPLQVQPVGNKDASPVQTAPPISKPVQPVTAAKPLPKPKPAPVDPMQTPESQMMIANLNAIARADPSLNTLMKIVATGTASPEQIREFQGYIQRAKAMGPSAYFKAQLAENANNEAAKQKAQKVKPPKPPKPAKKPKPPKEKLLTTFQELYVNGADLVFEFTENPNVRYNLPKECIIEKTGPEEILVSFLVIHNRDQIKKFRDRQRLKKEKLEKQKSAAADKEKEEGDKEKQNDNGEEKDKTEEGKDKPEDEKQPTGENETGKDKEANEGDKQEEDTSPKKPRRGRPKVTERTVKKEEKVEEVNEIPLQEEPIAYYSAISFKLTSVSSKYDPIFINSFHKYDKVKEEMEKVLKDGIRVPKTYVWYSVDAFEDEELAEGLRYQLYLIENPPKGKYKKRSMEDSLILNKPSTPAAKRVKTE